MGTTKYSENLPIINNDELDRPNYTTDTDQNQDQEQTSIRSNYSALEEIGFGWYQIKHILIFGLIITSDAAQVFLLSIVHPTLICKWKLKPMEVAFMSVVFMIFYMVGSSVGGIVSDKIGRRKTIIFTGILLVVMELVVPAAMHYTSFVIIYGITGIFIGCRYSISVTYLSEISPIKKRTMCVFSVKLFWAFGGIFETLISLAFLKQYGYKSVIFGTSVLTLLSLIVTAFLQESPRWLMANGHYSTALHVLQQAAYDNKKGTVNIVVKSPEIPETQQEIEEKSKILGVLFSKEHWRETVALSYIMFSCTSLYFSLLYLNTNLHIINYCGIGGGKNVHLLHLTDTCQVLDSDDYTDLLVTCIVEIPVLIIAVWAADYFGRIKTFKGFICMGSGSLALLIFCITSFNTEIQLFISRGIVDGLLLSVWVYVPELYPTRIRNVAVGWINTTGKLGAVLGIIFVQMFSTSHPHLIITICLLISLTALGTAFTLQKETKDKPLNESS